MFEIVFSSVEKIIGLFETLGYFGVFSLSFLDRLTIFLIPAEIVFPVYGILISQGKFLFWPAFILLTVGNFLGNVALYFIFLKGGRSFLEKYGKYVLVSKHELNHLDSWFLKYGNKIVFIGYLIPTAIRSLVPVSAGLSKMNLSKFCFYTFVSSLPLNFIYLFIGIKAGNNMGRILSYFEKFNYVVVAGIVVLVVWYVCRHIKNKHLTH